jgi:protein-disulfide isomerase
MNQIIETYGDDVQIVWKDNPLGFHPRAQPASNVARAIYKAKGDKAFWEAHDKLFESQPKLADEDLLAAVKDLGVPETVLKQAIETDKYAEKFEQSSDLANDFEARGTPHFFVNGLRVKGAQPFDAFKKVIDEQLAKAKAMEKKGIARSKIYEEIMKEGKTPPPPPKKELGDLPADAPAKGSANAKIVIQEFSDFECPFCSRVNPTIAEVLEKHSGDVKVV